MIIGKQAICIQLPVEITSEYTHGRLYLWEDRPTNNKEIKGLLTS